MDKIIVIDAYAYIYRSFYAIRNLNNAAGEPVNALYGMARLLLGMEEKQPSIYGAVAFDKGKCQRRCELLPDYKAQRPPMPAELRQQIPVIRQWLQAFGWPILEQQGVEADDLIAAVAAQRGNKELSILSFDKDLGQLVGNGVCMLTPGAKGSWQELGENDIEAKFGVQPRLLGDYLALVGDSADNIPGVRGFGSKTAAKLLLQYGSIEQIVQHLEELSPVSLQKKLRQAVEMLPRNRELIRLDPAVPDNWQGLNSITRQKPDWTEIEKLAEKEGFKSLLTAIQRWRQQEKQPSLF